MDSLQCKHYRTGSARHRRSSLCRGVFYAPREVSIKKFNMQLIIGLLIFAAIIPDEEQYQSVAVTRLISNVFLALHRGGLRNCIRIDVSKRREILLELYYVLYFASCIIKASLSLKERSYIFELTLAFLDGLYRATYDRG